MPHSFQTGCNQSGRIFMAASNIDLPHRGDGGTGLLPTRLKRINQANLNQPFDCSCLVPDGVCRYVPNQMGTGQPMFGLLPFRMMGRSIPRPHSAEQPMANKRCRLSLDSVAPSISFFLSFFLSVSVSLSLSRSAEEISESMPKH